MMVEDVLLILYPATTLHPYNNLHIWQNIHYVCLYISFRDDFGGVLKASVWWNPPETKGGRGVVFLMSIEICLIFALASTSCHPFFKKRGWKHRPRRSIKAHNYSSFHMHEASACKMSAMLCQPLSRLHHHAFSIHLLHTGEGCKW